jgi:hypothetical protein
MTRGGRSAAIDSREKKDREREIIIGSHHGPGVEDVELRLRVL